MIRYVISGEVKCKKYILSSFQSNGFLIHLGICVFMHLRQIHLNTLIRIGGVVTRRSGVFPQLQQVKYDCNKCGMILGPFFQNSYSEVRVGSCPECQSKGPFTVNVEQVSFNEFAFQCSFIAK